MVVTPVLCLLAAAALRAPGAPGAPGSTAESAFAGLNTHGANHVGGPRRG